MRSTHINHVMSSDVLSSGIFSDLLHRFAEHAPSDMTVEWTARPVPDADVYHYHRPQREWRLPPHSVVTVHHDLTDSLPWLDMRRFLPRYAEAARIICLNTGQASILRQRGLAHTVLIPHGADRNRVRPGRDKQPGRGRLRLGLFSRRYDRGVKGEDRLHALFTCLNPQDVEFLFVGENREIDALDAQRHGFFCDAIQFPPYRLFARLYQRVDMLLILSHFEGGPASLPEALAAGTPVAGTSVGMVPDILEDGVNGLLLSGEPAADAARLTTVARDPALLARLTAGARATDIPDWSQIMARHYSLYRDVAASKREAP